MANKNNWNLVAHCGLYCGECTAFLSKECGGCRSDEGLSREYRRYCKIYHCASSKNLKICLDCKEFPCKAFDFFKAERLEDSSWFLDVLNNMKLLKDTGLTKFLKKRESWLKRRILCAEKRGIKFCDACERWPCEFLKRPALVPVDLNKFEEFMKKIETISK